jgi:hypothetical protein
MSFPQYGHGTFSATFVSIVSPSSARTARPLRLPCWLGFGECPPCGGSAPRSLSWPRRFWGRRLRGRVQSPKRLDLVRDEDVFNGVPPALAKLGHAGRDRQLSEQKVPKRARTLDKMSIRTARDEDEAVVARRRCSENVDTPRHTVLPPPASKALSTSLGLASLRSPPNDSALPGRLALQGLGPGLSASYARDR